MKQRILQMLQERLEPLPFVYALWLEGADANGTADAYSDIDLWADIADEHEAEAIEAAEAALREIAELDYRYVMRHGHPKIRQRIYHLAGASDYLMIDFCWQLHSREDFAFYEGDAIEAARVLFDKSNVIRRKPFDLSAIAKENAALLKEAQYRYAQHVRVMKYVHRGQYLEAFAQYQHYVLEPLVSLLRLRHTPAHSDYGFVHISQHIPQASAERLAYFAKIASLAEITQKTKEAETWFAELLKDVPASFLR